MENLEQKTSELWWREKYLQLTIISLRNYQLTKNKKYYDFAKYFGEQSSDCRRRIEKLAN